MSRRTVVFAVLAFIIWSTIATVSAAYYYMQFVTYSDQLHKTQRSLNELAEKHDRSVVKWNLLVGDYSSLLGDYQWLPWEENGPTLTNRLGNLVNNLKGNYSGLLKNHYELNETYCALRTQYEELSQQATLAREDFGELLDEYYKLLTSIAIKDLEGCIGEATTLTVNLCIDYGNTTINWHNETAMPLGSTLLDLTEMVATIEKKYWSTMEPGHITVESINGYEQGYWLWYYWNEEKGEWTFGPVGCDAWMLSGNGTYKWYCSS